MATYRAKVIEEEVDYCLESDTEPYLSIADDEDCGSLAFYDDYLKPYDEDGYSPPKYLALDGVLKSIVERVLKEMGRSDLELYELDSTDDFEMETCYVFPTLRDEIKKSQLRQYRMTYYSVTVVRKEN